MAGGKLKKETIMDNIHKIKTTKNGRIIALGVDDPNGMTLYIDGKKEGTGAYIAPANKAFAPAGYNWAIDSSYSGGGVLLSAEELAVAHKVQSIWAARYNQSPQGYDEYVKTRSEWESVESKISGGNQSGALYARARDIKDQLAAIAAAHPGAVAAYKAERMAQASSATKSEIGRRAVASIRQGGDAVEALKAAEAEWSEAAMAALD